MKPGSQPQPRRSDVDLTPAAASPSESDTAQEATDDGAGSAPDPGMSVFDPNGNLLGVFQNQVRLSQNGQVITPTQNPFGVPEYTLPPQDGVYQLTLTEPNGMSTWDFHSAQPTTDATPAGSACVSGELGITGPCAPVPLIFLHYDAGADLNNSVPAPGVRQIGITGSHLDPTAPPVTTMKVWTSVDGGKTWVPATTANTHGTFIATYAVPQVSATHGAVSFKVQAKDAGGNDTTQILTDDIRLANR